MCHTCRLSCERARRLVRGTRAEAETEANPYRETKPNAFSVVFPRRVARRDHAPLLPPTAHRSRRAARCPRRAAWRSPPRARARGARRVVGAHLVAFVRRSERVRDDVIAGSQCRSPRRSRTTVGLFLYREGMSRVSSGDARRDGGTTRQTEARRDESHARDLPPRRGSFKQAVEAWARSRTASRARGERARRDATKERRLERERERLKRTDSVSGLVRGEFRPGAERVPRRAAGGPDRVCGAGHRARSVAVRRTAPYSARVSLPANLTRGGTSEPYARRDFGPQHGHRREGRADAVPRRRRGAARAFSLVTTRVAARVLSGDAPGRKRRENERTNERGVAGRPRRPLAGTPRYATWRRASSRAATATGRCSRRTRPSSSVVDARFGDEVDAATFRPPRG